MYGPKKKLLICRVASWCVPPDALQVGNGGFTFQEARAAFSLYCIGKHPIILSFDLAAPQCTDCSPADVFQLLSNPGMLASCLVRCNVPSLHPMFHSGFTAHMPRANINVNEYDRAYTALRAGIGICAYCRQSTRMRSVSLPHPCLGTYARVNLLMWRCMQAHSPGVGGFSCCSTPA